MAYKLIRQQVIDTALAQVGKVCGKSSEYAKELDAVHFYNYPKDGVANSCKIFVDDMIYRCIEPQTAYNARDAVCEPNKGENCGAGCTQAVQYFKSAGRWYEPFNSKGGCTACKGDEIFFKKSNGAFYHTGIVVDWDNKGLYTVEGNVDGGKVAKRFYYYNDSKIGGFGRPKYTQNDYDTQQDDAATKPEPVKEKRYTVKVNTCLNVRSGAGTNYKVIGRLYNGDKVTVYEVENNFGRIAKGKWVCMNYLK